MMVIYNSHVKRLGLRGAWGHDNSKERSEAQLSAPVYLTQIIPVQQALRRTQAGTMIMTKRGIDERIPLLTTKVREISLAETGHDNGPSFQIRYAALVRRGKLPITEAAYSLLRAAAVTGNADGGSKGKGLS